MNLRLLALGVATLLAGCAGVPAQSDQYAASSKGCKIAYYDSAGKQISAYNSDMHKQAPYAQSPAEQELGVLGVDKAQNRNPRLRGRGLPNVLDDAHYGC